VEHIAKSHIRKEAVVAKVLERRGDHPGLMHIRPRRTHRDSLTQTR